MKIKLFILTFLASAIALAQTLTRTLPPTTTIVKENMTFTVDNFGFSMHYGDHQLGLHNNYGQGFPIEYNSTPQPNPYPNLELLDFSPYGTTFRNFYPNGRTMYDPDLGLGLNSLRGLLDEADILHSNGKKLLLAGEIARYTHGESSWVDDLNSPEHEQAMIDYHTDLLTSSYTNPPRTFTTTNGDVVSVGLGFTFANHPAIEAYEPFNEQVRSATANTYSGAYARDLRIITTLFEQYKPDCKIISFTVQGGEGANLVKMLRASAESIINPKVGTGINNDDGTNKTAADYTKKSTNVHSHHAYQEGLETKSTYDEWIANNTYADVNRNLHYDHMLAPYRAEMEYNPNSPLYGRDVATQEIWNTESGIAAGEGVSAYQGGIRTFMMDDNEQLYHLLTWFGSLSSRLQDGEGGSSKNFEYKGDLPGISYSGTLGTNGTITNITAGEDGRVRVTLSTPAGTGLGWIENMRIVITAPAGGWADLGLAAGEKKRFTTSVIDNNSNTLDLKNTTFTTVPTGEITYTEYQLSHSVYPEARKRFMDIMTDGLISFGWTANGSFVIVNDSNVYLLENGKIKTW